MKEKLYTIPLNDAFLAEDECPFCFIERKLEQDLLDFVLGSCSSYMESDVREATDKAGFCRLHFKKMFDYGNTLGNAWILKTHYQKMITEMDKQFQNFQSPKPSIRAKFQKAKERQNPIGIWTQEKESSCYICNRFQDTYERYLDTFFVMYNKDTEFQDRVKSSKGFCLPHFGDLCEMAETKMNAKQKEDFFPAMFTLMRVNMERIANDVSWMVEKFDYRNKDADWKQSKDAIQRGMQKLKSGYPADPVYKANK